MKTINLLKAQFLLVFMLRSVFAIITPTPKLENTYYQNENSLSDKSAEMFKIVPLEYYMDTSSGNRIHLPNNDKKPSGETERKEWNYTSRWNYIDDKKPWTPHEKTLSLSVLEDYPHPWYYSSGLYDSFRNRSSSPTRATVTDTTRGYEWQRLPAIDSSYYSNNPIPYSTSRPSRIVTTNANGNKEAFGSATAATSLSVETTKRHVIPGLPNLHSYYNNYFNYPYEYHHRGRRFRLAIHPGLIAAPLAGLAAYGAANAIAKHPLTFEFGLSDQRPSAGWGWGGWQRPVYYPASYPVSNYPVSNYPAYPAYPPPAYHPPAYPPPAPAVPTVPYPSPEYPGPTYPHNYPPNYFEPASPVSSSAAAAAVGEPIYPIIRPGHAKYVERVPPTAHTPSYASTFWNMLTGLTPRY